MLSLPTSHWFIESVVVNNDTVVTDDGFVELQINEDELLIEPVGIRFLVAEAHEDGLTLVSNEQVYRATLNFDGEFCAVSMNRPEISDTIQIHARIHKNSMNPVEREVVQV